MRALARGWSRRRPRDEVVCVPLADGGEGTLDALGAGLDPGCRRAAVVTGPGGEPVDVSLPVRDAGGGTGAGALDRVLDACSGVTAVTG